MRAIETCRTAVLGGHAEKCSQCDYSRVAYNSCRNRHCPDHKHRETVTLSRISTPSRLRSWSCQNTERARWLEARTAELLPVEYFHIVFTLPQEIARIAFHNRRTVYGILFRAAAETLLTIARDPRHLGAEIGFFGILHTWGQNLLHHPHVHFVVPGGGIGPDCSWVRCRPGFFLPVRVLSRLFRRLFLQYLREAFRRKQLQLPGEAEPLRQAPAFDAYLAPLGKAEWVVYSKPPFGGPRHVLEYLGRYSHRVALSNDRILDVSRGEVTFQWKDYRTPRSHKSRRLTLGAHEFIRRFLIHVLPPRFQRIRYFGLFASRRRKEKLASCRTILCGAAAELLPDRTQCAPLLRPVAAHPFAICPQCRSGVLIRIAMIPAYYWPKQPPDSS